VQHETVEVAQKPSHKLGVIDFPGIIWMILVKMGAPRIWGVRVGEFQI
jgi:hypothetical protein